MFEKHCCRVQTREVGGRGGPLATNNAGGGGALSESMSRAACVKHGKIIMSVRVAHALGFRPLDLVAVVGGGRRSSSGGQCHPMHP